LIRATICEIVKEDKILLQLKKAGKFGEGKWNGPGGKILFQESPREGVIREVYEETGLTLLNPALNGWIDFYFGEKSEPDWITYIFLATEFKGEIYASDEGELKWFKIKDIPYEKMWKDDQYWLPAFLKGKKIRGTFWFDHGGLNLIRHQLTIE
jgi:8-oxo-dGTP pyrophosphatase MutT (NUDIX family)